MFLTSTAGSLTAASGVSATAKACNAGSYMYTNVQTVAGSAFPTLYSQTLRASCAQRKPPSLLGRQQHQYHLLEYKALCQQTGRTRSSACTHVRVSA